MGSTISIETQQSNLDELLSLSPSTFTKLGNEALLTDFSHHLRIWRFQEDPHNPDLIKSQPLSLSTAQTFKSQECYLVLLISHSGKDYSFEDHPGSIINIIESITNLTPRGLENVFSTDDSAMSSLLLSKNEINEALHYALFVWNGKRANPLLKAFALTKGFELENQVSKGGAKMLKSLFNGSVIKGKKIQQGSVMSLNSAYENEALRPENSESFEVIRKWLSPEQPNPSFLAKPLFPKFREHFLIGPGEPYFVACQENTPPPALPKISLPKLDMKPDLKPKLGIPIPGLNIKKDEESKPKYDTKEEIDELENNHYLSEKEKKQIKLDFYDKICSELDDGLYVGSDRVARDLNLLKANGITHIINCAGNVCKNYYPDDFAYLTFFLKDSKTEPIESVFYPTIEFIDNALQSGGKVYVHCMQGVSRSVSVCLAYIIFKRKRPYDLVIKEAKQKRGVCSPNVSFEIQLMWWHKRLFENFDSLSISPRVFAICSHEIEQPRRIVARLLMQNLYRGPDKEVLDSRGVFIIQTENVTYLWIGKELPSCNRNAYLEVAEKHIWNLRQYEKAKEHIEVYEGEEPDYFWASWKCPRPAVTSGKNPSMNNWYFSLDTAVDMEPQTQEEEIIEEPLENKPKAYVYPELRGMTVLDEVELNEDEMVCLCTDEKCYLWRGELCEVEEEEEEQFVRDACINYYGFAGAIVVREQEGLESPEFNSYF
ncbi:unnamed protein product [Blepharisma stoltei]|uniref:Dual specificity phosphatase n=1 Tax=Blepharisma stoltei TaxID=1481888 RepID=A0AAU9JK94_9CILI|nr:unnamed protein product [Blepharisma stoltei]